VESGQAVLTIDVRGMGETAPADTASADYRGFTMDGESGAFYGALHLQRTLVGMRVQDARSAVAYLATRPEIDARRIVVAGTGAGGVFALYAAAVEPGIKAVVSINALASYRAFAETDLYTVRHTLLVPKVLESFDLPDVAGLIAPRSVTIINPIDAAHRPIEYKDAAANTRILRTSSASVILKTLQ
jgi:cephalosporin-C deacetylase-like acetyl esterase